MILTVYLIIYIIAIVLEMGYMLKMQFELFAAYKQKKKPDFPITISDAYHYTRTEGYDPNNPINVQLFSKRLHIIFSHYPEDKSLDGMARGVRALFYSLIVTMIGGFGGLIVLGLALPPTAN